MLKGPVLKTSRRIIKDLKEHLAIPGSGNPMARDSTSKKAFKSNKLFEADKSKQKRFDYKEDKEGLEAQDFN